MLGQYEIVQFNEYNGSVVSLLFMGRMSLLMHYDLIGQRTQIPLPSRDGSTRPDRFGTLSSSCPLRTSIKKAIFRNMIIGQDIVDEVQISSPERRHSWYIFDNSRFITVV